MLALQALRRPEQLFSYLIARASEPAPRVFSHSKAQALEVHFRRLRAYGQMMMMMDVFICKLPKK
jgi:hypothetical protein